jgi:cytochrome c peroxidase
VRAGHHALIALILAGCGSETEDGARTQDGAPSFTQAELDLLSTLAPTTLPAPPPDASNRFADDPAAQAFGQRLFFEAGFSGKLLDGDNDGTKNALGNLGDTGKVSCAGCHVPDAGFLDDRTLGKQISLGAGWGLRRSPSLLDVGQAGLLMWDGRHDALYNQPFGPLESPVEMNTSRLFTAQVLHQKHRAEYEALFGEMPPLDDTTRFPALTPETTGCQSEVIDTLTTCEGTEHGIPGDGAEFDGLTPQDQDAVTEVVVNLGKALGAYQRLLSCGTSRFDDWMHGDSEALSFAEQRGAQLFVGKAGCVGCHSGPYLSDQKFHNVGLQPKPVAVVFLDADDRGAAHGLELALDDPLNVRGEFSDGDDGRLPETVTPEMEGAFRTPTLRCVAQRPSFFHTGHVRTLEEVVAFFSRGGDHFGFPGTSEIAPLDLTEGERSDLVAFLRALDGPGPDANLRKSP